MARKTKIPANRVNVGDRFPELRLTAITGETISIPDTAGHLTHLQFRRFAGCPICNVHLHSITGRIDEISAAGIREVVVFHSTASELRKYQGDMPFPVIGDPYKALYRRFGVEASAKAVSIRAPGAHSRSAGAAPLPMPSRTGTLRCRWPPPTATWVCPRTC